MKRVLTIAAAILLAAAPAFADPLYGWSVSSSSSDPNANVGGAASGFTSLYLWFNCGTEGAGGAEFNVATTGGNIGVSFTGVAGVLNATAYPWLSLGLGGCRVAPFLAGSIGYLNNGDPTATVCLVNSGGGIRVTVDCATPVPAAWPMAAVGWGASAPACVEELCPVVSVDDSSWGSIKSLYR
jgi:hypothetical protein